MERSLKKIMDYVSPKSSFKQFSIVLLILLFGGAAWCAESKPATTGTQTAKSVSVEEFEILKKKVQVLEDKDAIWSLLSRYSLNVDLGRGEDFLKLFTDDCIFATDVSGGQINYRRGKKELGEMVATAPPKGQHLQLDYHINVDGDTADAYGYQDLTTFKGTGVTLGRAAYRHLKFKRVNGVWLIQEVWTIGIDNDAEGMKILPPHM
jgi:hypothetical protein